MKRLLLRSIGLSDVRRSVLNRLMFSAALLSFIAPGYALAQTYLVQERGPDPATANTTLGIASPNGVELPAVEVNGATPAQTQKAPTEPIGCSSFTAGQSCWTDLASSLGVYGWPKAEVAPYSLRPSEKYIVVSNFWNNEAVLGDATLYPDGKIYVPGERNSSGTGRAIWGVPFTQYALPDRPSLRQMNADPNPFYPNPFQFYKDANGSWGGKPQPPYVSGTLEVAVNTSNAPSTPLFKVSASTVKSRGATDADGSDLIDERYYPAAYPSIIKGCHTTNCTQPGNGGQDGAPFPIQIQDLGNIPSNWTVTVGGEAATADMGVYDVAYDIWLDIGRRPATCKKHCLWNAWGNSSAAADDLPEGNKFVMQPYGTEVMIWVGYNDGKNRAAGAATDPGLVQPAGRKVTSMIINGVNWDVWIGYGRDTQDTQLYWNIVSFIRPQFDATNCPSCYDNFAKNLTFNMDTRPFIDAMVGLDGTTADAGTGLVKGCPIAYVNDVPKAPVFETTATNASQTVNDNIPCAHPTWWLTDIDAGFEIWDHGQGLQTDSFYVRPTFNKVVSSERLATDGTTPVIYWQKAFQLWQDPVVSPSVTSCGADPVTFDMQSAGSFQTDAAGTSLLNWCDTGSRWYSGAETKTSTCANGTAGTQGAHKAMADLNGNSWYALIAPMANGGTGTMWDKGMHGAVTVTSTAAE